MGAKKIDVQVGDILRVPVDDFFVAAKIIWISQWHKDATGIVIFPGWFESADQVRPVKGDYLIMKMGKDDVKVLYPSIKNVTGRKTLSIIKHAPTWSIIGHSPLDERDKKLRFHLVAGILYDGDETVRFATLDDYANYPSVLAAGPIVVQNLIRQARPSMPRID